MVSVLFFDPKQRMYDDITNLESRDPVTRKGAAESLYRVLIYTGVLWE